jgi:biotin operon repressor
MGLSAEELSPLTGPRQEAGLTGERSGMLFKRLVLQAIARGDVSLAFRRWKRPSVRVGTRLRTEAGLLAVDSVDRVEEADISEGDARRAGFASRELLLADLRLDPQAQLYRIGLRLEGVDPRMALLDETALSSVSLRQVRDQLERWDRTSPGGAWTQMLLRTIADYPQQPAAELAKSLQRDRDWLKVQVRKLKELGLTESLHPGYRLSQRGLALLLEI